MHVFNETHLHWQQIKAHDVGFIIQLLRLPFLKAPKLPFDTSLNIILIALKGTLVDDFWVIKHEHRPYSREDRRKLKRYGTYIDYNTRVDRPKPLNDPSEL